MSDRLLEDLAAWVVKTSFGDIPGTVQEVAKRAIVDYVGVTLAGETSPISELLDRYVEQTPGAEEAALIGRSGKASAETAAFVNGAQGHALDFDDCNDSLGGHPTIVVLPPALAVAERLGVGGAELLEAYILGVEVTTKIGRAVNYTHYKHGWHPTATLGVFGSAVAAGKLMRFDAEQMATALSIAASTAAGLKANFGTTTKPIQAGRAAQNGVFAAKLAALGATANPGAFEHMHGFGPVFNGDGFFDADAARALGEPWDMLDPGLTFKQYPCCASTHAAIDAALDLRREVADPADIVAVHVRPHPNRLPHTDRQKVRTGFEGKFSVQYVTAVALLRGHVGIGHFEQDTVDDPEVQRLTSIVDAQPLPEERWGDDQFAAEVTVELADGTELAGRVERPRGNGAGVPLTDAEIARKFSDCCQASGRAETYAQELHAALMNIEDESGLPRVVQLLSSPS